MAKPEGAGIATIPAEEMVKEIKEIVTNDFAEVKKEVAEIKGISEDLAKMRTAVDQLETKMKSQKIEIRQKYFEGQKAARLWKCQILADSKRISKEEAAAEIYGNDEIFQAEVKALTAGGNAGKLIEEAYYGEIIPLLYNKLAVMALGARKVPMPKGNLTIRRVVSGSTASYIGESSKVNATKPVFGSLMLSAKKLVVKVPFSNDLLRSASPDADMYVRDDMVQQLKLKMDYTAFYGTGTQFTPRGIKKVSGVTDGSASAALDGDSLYAKLVVPVKNANTNMISSGWVFNPTVFGILYNEQITNGAYKYRDELQKGRFHGFPYVETNQIAVGSDAHGLTDIFFGDFSDFIIGEQMELEVRASEEATYADESGTARSAFDYDETVVKAMMIHDMGVARPKSFSWGQFYTVA